MPKSARSAARTSARSPARLRPGDAGTAHIPRPGLWHLPVLGGADLGALVADIKANSLREPITLHPDGSILDGRNRYRACLEAGVECNSVEWDGRGTEVEFVISMNLARRHLSTSQRAMVAARLAKIPHGVRKDYATPANSPVITQTEAAQQLNVGSTAVKEAKRVLDSGDAKLVQAVDEGEISVSRAAKIIRSANALHRKP